MPDYGLGRLHAPDDRDFNHLMTARLSLLDGAGAKPVKLKRARIYRGGRQLDQGSTPRCTGYSARQFLQSAPLMYRDDAPDADQLYHEAQLNDEWPGEDYDGSSVRGAAKALRLRGLIAEYLWAFDVDTIRQWMLSDQGTVVLGTNWYESMFDVTKSGFVRIAPNTRIAGGHAYLLIGCSDDQEAVRIYNSWGSSWGQHGRAWLSYDDLSRLLSEDGEALTATETAPNIQP